MSSHDLKTTTARNESDADLERAETSNALDDMNDQKSEKDEKRSNITPSISETAADASGSSPKALEAGVTSDDVILIDWEGPDDPANPKNWPFKRKWAATAIISAFTFISPVSSSMVAPATDQIAREFGITSTVIIAMTTSIFVLAYAVGPLFLGPLSEIYGRSRVVQGANLFYLAWNLACGFAQNKNQLLAFRFLAGIGGSAPLAIGGGVLSDCWRPEERGMAMALYSLGPLLGPALGPVAGAWIAAKSTWRWVFWSTTIVDALVQVLGFFYLDETFPPLLLERKAKAFKKGLPESDTRHIRTPFQGEHRHWKRIFAKALVRPFAIFFREPIIQLLGCYMALVYGLIYLVLTTMPAIFGGTYHESVGIAGLHYIALGLGLMGAAQLNARLVDRIYGYCKNRYGGVGKPEFRLPGIVPGTIVLPLGLLIMGWCAQTEQPWISVDIGIALIGAGMIINFQGIQTYVVDAFTLHAASAIAAVSCLRSLAGFGFPLFAPALYAALGYGKGNTILACAAIVFGCPAPFLLWKYGEAIRVRSRYAAKDRVDLG